MGGREKTMSGRWFKLAKVVGGEPAFKIDVDDQTFYVHEPIDELFAIYLKQAPSEEQLMSLMDGIRKTIDKMQLKKPIMIVPEAVGFAKFVEVSPAEARALEKINAEPKTIEPEGDIGPVMGNA